jgi:hypothetical protein
MKKWPYKRGVLSLVHNLVIFYYISSSKPGLIKGEAFDGSVLIRGGTTRQRPDLSADLNDKKDNDPTPDVSNSDNR